MDFYASEMEHCGDPRGADQPVDRAFWRRAARSGLVCSAVPSEYGGGGGSVLHDFAAFDAQGRVGFGGFDNAVHSGILARYLLADGSAAQKRRWLPAMATGELVGAVAVDQLRRVTDLAALPIATRRGADWVLNGSTVVASCGGPVDLFLVAARTDPAAGLHGISLLLVEGAATQGFSIGRPAAKGGTHSHDLTELRFSNAQVPGENLVGDEGAGFNLRASQLPHEHLIGAVSSLAAAESTLAMAVARVEHEVVGSSPARRETQFELAECATLARVVRAYVDASIEQHVRAGVSVRTALKARWWVAEMEELLGRTLLAH